MKVTAETITDEQIRCLLDELLGDALAHAHKTREMDACRMALGVGPRRRHLSGGRDRELCAAAWNTIHGGES